MTAQGKDHFESTWIIGSRQFEKARELFEAPDGDELSGTVDFRHMWVDMTNVSVNFNGKTVKTCKPAMGFRF